jgi:hypothetical protein
VSLLSSQRLSPGKGRRQDIEETKEKRTKEREKEKI